MTNLERNIKAQYLHLTKKQRDKVLNIQQKADLQKTILLSVVFVVILLGIFINSFRRLNPVICSTTSVIVRNGDTLWDISKRYSKDMDVRKMIWDIKNLNKIDGNIKPGQRLIIPLYK